ncbi:MAG: hypothetical protein ACK5LJ_03990 [Paracoccus sp. (in: a-proteobacteria)]
MSSDERRDAGPLPQVLRRLGSVGRAIFLAIAKQILGMFLMILIGGTGLWIMTDMGALQSYALAATIMLLLMLIGGASS